MMFLFNQHRRASSIRLLLVMLLFQMFSQQSLATALNLADTHTNSHAGDEHEHSLHSAPFDHENTDGHPELTSGCDNGDCLDMFCQTICHSGITVTVSDLLVPLAPFPGEKITGQVQTTPPGIDLYPETKPPQAPA